MEKQESVREVYTLYKEKENSSQFLYVKRAVDLLVKCLSESKFQNFYVSFNGGKDATIALFLTYIAMREVKMQKVIPCLYFSEPRPFPQTEEFIKKIESQIQLSIIRFKTKSYATELTTLQQQKGLDWIVMGSRKDDPGCAHLGHIAPSDTHKGYPKFNRINPLIGWEYNQVWQFILGFNIPYCSLYDQGYTYLGNKDNTVKNQSLYDPEQNTYKKAYEADKHLQTVSRKLKPFNQTSKPVQQGEPSKE